MVAAAQKRVKNVSGLDIGNPTFLNGIFHRNKLKLELQPGNGREHFARLSV
jgi:hypothetical protein